MSLLLLVGENRMTYKENIVNCENCGKPFNNAYKTQRWTKIGCSRKCQRILCDKKNFLKAKERRHRLRAEHKCIVCGIKVKPKIVYHQFCSKHKPK